MSVTLFKIFAIPGISWMSSPASVALHPMHNSTINANGKKKRIKNFFFIRFNLDVLII